MDCKTCKEERGLIMMPTVTHESAMARAERHMKRLWIIILVLIFLFVGTNIAWMVYESQFEDVTTTTVEQDNESGHNNYIGNDGDISNGTPKNN